MKKLIFSMLAIVILTLAIFFIADSAEVDDVSSSYWYTLIIMAFFAVFLATSSIIAARPVTEAQTLYVKISFFLLSALAVASLSIAVAGFILKLLPTDFAITAIVFSILLSCVLLFFMIDIFAKKKKEISKRAILINFAVEFIVIAAPMLYFSR